MRNEVPPGAERRAATSRAWYEENSPGQRRNVSAANLPLETSQVPVLEVRDFGEPAAITLQLDRDFIRGTAYNAKIVAQVTYGVGGASDSFLVDWADGTLITVVAQRLTVVAKAEQALFQIPFNMGDLEMGLVCAVGKGQPSVIMPTYTKAIVAVPPAGTSPPVKPPAFAKALSVIARDVGGIDPYPNFYLTQNVVGVPWGSVLGAYLAGGAAMPLCPEAEITLTVTGPNSIAPAFIWHLAL